MSLTPASAQEPAARFIGAGAWRRGLAYGLLGLPLAFVALPLYVILPNHYARNFAVPLAALGAVLLAARLFDAVLDPLIGRWTDRLFARSHRAVLAAGGVAAVALALGLWGLLFPPAAARADATALLVWAGAVMAVTYAAYSVASVAHQTWGTRLGGTEAQRSRISAWREGLALVGVLTAAVLPGTLGLDATVIAFAVLLALGWWAWSRSIAPPPGTVVAAAAGASRSLWSCRASLPCCANLRRCGGRARALPIPRANSSRLESPDFQHRGALSCGYGITSRQYSCGDRGTF